MVGRQRDAGGGWLFAGSGTCFALREEMELVDISGQVQDQSKEVVPAGLTTQFVSLQDKCDSFVTLI